MDLGNPRIGQQNAELPTVIIQIHRRTQSCSNAIGLSEANLFRRFGKVIFTDGELFLFCCLHKNVPLTNIYLTGSVKVEARARYICVTIANIIYGAASRIFRLPHGSIVTTAF